MGDILLQCNQADGIKAHAQITVQRTQVAGR